MAFLALQCNQLIRTGYYKTDWEVRAMQTAVDIGNKIVIARKLKNLSQVDLAAQMSVTSQAVGKWERGESMPDLLTFDRLSSVLGVELNYFSERCNNKTPLGEAAGMPSDTDGTEDEENDRRKPEWNMSGGVWSDGDFSGLANLGDRFSGSNIKNCKFIGSELQKLTLRGNNVHSSDFSGSDLRECLFRGCNIQLTSFSNCNMSGAEYARSNIQKCDFTEADFTDAEFRSCNIKEATLTGAIWLRTVFRISSLSDLTFDSNITDCSFVGLEKPSRLVFRGVTFRNTFFKNCNLDVISRSIVVAISFSFASKCRGKS